MVESYSVEPESASSCLPKNSTIKYDDIYGGIPVNLGINVAVWLVSKSCFSVSFYCKRQSSIYCTHVKKHHAENN